MTLKSKKEGSNLPFPTFLYFKLRQLFFPGSRNFWETRYALGGDSGKGSFGRLAEFKSDVVNDFVQKQRVASVIEFGCGDGNQLSHARYPRYVGLDPSKSAIAKCLDRFAEDNSKSFFLYDPFCFNDNLGVFKADLAVSLDVIYHLVEDEVFHSHLSHLFASAERFVIIYSSNIEKKGGAYERHVRHRNFTTCIADCFPNWKLKEKIQNKYPKQEFLNEGSPADFFIFEPR